MEPSRAATKMGLCWLCAQVDWHKDLPVQRYIWALHAGSVGAVALQYPPALSCRQSIERIIAISCFSTYSIMTMFSDPTSHELLKGSIVVLASLSNITLLYKRYRSRCMYSVGSNLICWLGEETERRFIYTHVLFPWPNFPRCLCAVSSICGGVQLVQDRKAVLSGLAWINRRSSERVSLRQLYSIKRPCKIGFWSQSTLLRCEVSSRVDVGATIDCWCLAHVEMYL